MQIKYLLPLLPQIIFIFVIYFIIRSRNKHNKNISEYTLKQLQDKTVYSKLNIKADVYAYGRKDKGKLFNRCDLYLLPGAILLLPYAVYFTKIYRRPLLLTRDTGNYSNFNVNGIIPNLKKVNPDSFSKQVYIEYGEAGFNDTSVEIHLKGLTDEERAYFNSVK